MGLTKFKKYNLRYSAECVAKPPNETRAKCMQLTTTEFEM